MDDKTRYSADLVSESNLYVDTVTDRVGIGSLIPTSKLDVIGDVKVSGVITASSFSGNATYAAFSGVSTSVVGGIGSIAQLSVSGVSTLGILKVDSGIVTATSGIITYYGDGSKLSNVTGLSISTNTTNSNQYLTYSVSLGSTTGLGVTTSGLVFNPSTSRLGIGTTNPTSRLHIGAASTSAANNSPFKLTSGGTANLLATPENGAIEYDGAFIYQTPNSTSGRSYIPPTYSFRRTTDGTNIGTGITDFFTTPSSLSLEASSVYKIECLAYFTKNLDGDVIWTHLFSSAPIFVDGFHYSTPITGMSSGITTSYTPYEQYFYNQGVTSYTWAPNTSKSTGSVNHLYKLRMTVVTNAATNWRLRLTQDGGTATPLTGSYYTVEKIGSSTGNFVP